VTGGERTEIFTDGACQGNSGPGGWAVVLYEGGQRRIISGNDRRTTANRMELTAMIQAMEAAPKGLPLMINSENHHLVEIIKRGRERTANLDLWERVDRLRAELDVSWWWVRTRRGNPGSEIAGRVANMEAGLFETGGSPRRRFNRAPSSSSQRQGRPPASQRSVTQQSGQKQDAGRQSGSQPSGNQPSRPQQNGDQRSRPPQGGQRPNATRSGRAETKRHPARRQPTRPTFGPPAQKEPMMTSPNVQRDATLTHLDAQGRVSMVDVGDKPVTDREAVARGRVSMQPETLRLIGEGLMKKGDVLTIAQLAGIMGAKLTSQLIPLCHPLPLNKVDVDLALDEPGSGINITATARTSGKTGVEMEALTAVSVAALTVYDMCKAVDRAMRIEGIRLVRKRGGQSGDVDLDD
jgi:cyclic pyranopterin phosphate synthase